MLRRLAAERMSPREVALGVCLGIVVGTTPFWGAHTVICVGLASVLRLNRVIAVLASNYSIPPLIPLLAFVSMQIGRLITTGETLPVSYASFAELDPMAFARDWLIGAPVLGLVLGVPTGLLAAAAVSRQERRKALSGGA